MNNFLKQEGIFLSGTLLLMALVASASYLGRVAELQSHTAQQSAQTNDPVPSGQASVAPSEATAESVESTEVAPAVVQSPVPSIAPSIRNRDDDQYEDD